MAQSNQTMLAVLLVVGLVIGAGAGYMLAPKGGVVTEIIGVPDSIVIKEVFPDCPSNYGRLDVFPIYSSVIPQDLSSVQVYSDGTYIYFVWWNNSYNTLMWSYAKVRTE